MNTKKWITFHRFKIHYFVSSYLYKLCDETDLDFVFAQVPQQIFIAYIQNQAKWTQKIIFTFHRLQFILFMFLSYWSIRRFLETGPAFSTWVGGTTGYYTYVTEFSKCKEKWLSYFFGFYSLIDIKHQN